MASIHISVVNSFYHFGSKRYFIPSNAPERKEPLISRTMKKKKGDKAVNITILPDYFTPFLTMW
jgi:hypothetical protein